MTETRTRGVVRWLIGLSSLAIGCEPALIPDAPGWQLGVEGTPPVVVQPIYDANGEREATDLAFDPMHDNRVWVMLREFVSAEGIGCEQQDPIDTPGCLGMSSRTVTIDGPGSADPQMTEIVDSNAWHFMRRAPALAMGAHTGFWASCGEHRTANHTGSPVNFMGPTLWSSDLSLHGNTPENGNGSHYDMLHDTPWCTGIAWEVDNVYWAFNGELGALDRVNFNEDHGPGAADHSDGEYARYAEGQLQRQPNVPSHMEIEGDWLYVADPGNGRVVRLDITSGTVAEIGSTLDPVPVERMEGETLEVVVELPEIGTPSGLTVHEDVLFVSDFREATVYAFHLDGTALGQLDLSDVAQTVTGLEISPEGYLYFVDKAGGSVYRLVPELDE